MYNQKSLDFFSSRSQKILVSGKMTNEELHFFFSVSREKVASPGKWIYGVSLYWEERKFFYLGESNISGYRHPDKGYSFSSSSKKMELTASFFWREKKAPIGEINNQLVEVFFLLME